MAARKKSSARKARPSKSTTPRPKRLPHGLERETFSVKEAGAIAGIAEKTVRNEIHVDLFRVTLDDKSDVAISARGVVYLRLIAQMPVYLAPRDRNAISRMLAEGWPGAEGWRRKGDILTKGMVQIDVGSAEREAIERMRIFVHGRKSIESDTGGPAGEMLFKDSQIRVRMVGALLAQGADPKKMRAAFPTLTADDIASAGMFARVNRGPGSNTARRATREFRYRPIPER
jgi:uncharacterized protein (DUF433 family)